VYKDRDPEGFKTRAIDLGFLGVDQVVSDRGSSPSSTPKISGTPPPFVRSFPEPLPRACVGFQRVKTLGIDPRAPRPSIQDWSGTHLTLKALGQGTPIGDRTIPLLLPDLLILQKTFLPGWKGKVNGEEVQATPLFDVLTAVPLQAGENDVELRFDPTGLRLGFFLLFLLSGLLAFLLLRPRLR
jgi:hypothetical protein